MHSSHKRKKRMHFLSEQLITFTQTRPTNRCEYKKSHTYHINYNTFVYLTKNLIIFVSASIRFRHKWWKNKAVIRRYIKRLMMLLTKMLIYSLLVLILTVSNNIWINSNLDKNASLPATFLATCIQLKYVWRIYIILSISYQK